MADSARKSILVAEDEVGVRLIIREALLADGTGYVVDEAADGREALEKVRAGPYDVLLSDILMPHMDGMELLRILHREEPGLPVVVITAVGDEACVLSCLAEGAWDYVLKPFDVEQLRAVVRRALAAGDRFEQKPDDFEVTSRGSGRLEFTAASETEYVHRFRRFTEVLLRAKLPPTVREDIRLAVEEIGRNAIEWGNRFERRKRIHLAYKLHDDRITFLIEDEGQGFLHEALPDPSLDTAAHMARRSREGKRPGGFGIHIVKKVMDEVSFSEKGNTVVMTKHLS